MKETILINKAIPRIEGGPNPSQTHVLRMREKCKYFRFGRHFFRFFNPETGGFSFFRWSVVHCCFEIITMVNFFMLHKL